MSLYLGENCISAGGSSAFKNNNIGEIIQSTIPLTDAGLHLLDGSLISGSGAYSAFVTYIASLVSSYPDLFETEANWQTSVTTYGVCGKFVYDSVNNTVRLPKITGFTEGTIDPTVLGDLTQAGLPNIEGTTYIREAHGRFMGLQDNTGCIDVADSGVMENANGGSDTSGNKPRQLKINASLSNPIYGNSSTVQPQSIKVLYYIVIATSTKTSIEVDIDEVMTDLNGKADVDLSNVKASGTSLASGWAMPSSRYINLTLGASGATYTAPANGWFVLIKQGSSGQHCTLCQKSTQDNFNVSYSSFLSASSDARTSLPVKKGQEIQVFYTASGTLRAFKFYYAEGESNV